jgi:hypothetical protein
MSDHFGGLARSARGEGADLLPVAVPFFAPPPALDGALHELGDEHPPAETAPRDRPGRGAPAATGTTVRHGGTPDPFGQGPPRPDRPAAPVRPGDPAVHPDPGWAAARPGPERPAAPRERPEGARALPPPLPGGLPEPSEPPAPATPRRHPPASREPAAPGLQAATTPAVTVTPPPHGPGPGGWDAAAADAPGGPAARDGEQRRRRGEGVTAMTDPGERPGEWQAERRAAPPSVPPPDRGPVATVTGTVRERTQPAVPERPAADPTGAATVQVSIGRIEVRAAPPPEAPPPEGAPPAPPAPRAPTLSLDDYLRRRERGGGR